MKNIKRSLLGIMAALFVLVALTTTSTLAGGGKSEDSKELIVSFDENFTSNSTIDGTTTLAGAFSDKGARHEDFTTSQNGNEVTVTGTVTITTSKGTLISKFTGVIPAGPTITYIEGVEYISGGTGAYAKAKGNGTFEATIDFDTGNIVGVAEFSVKNGK